MYCQSNRTVSKKRFVSSPVNPLKQGFTLVELMVSLVILALLASAVSVSIRSYLIRSKQSIAKIEISRMSQAVEAFYATFDRYPTNDEGIEVLVSKSDEFPEGLLDFLPSDPWEIVTSIDLRETPLHSKSSLWEPIVERGELGRTAT